MTDRELLELAAKAAGIPLSHWEDDDDKPFDENTDSYWNPLTYDGDALRLAVKLGLDVCIDTPMETDPHTHAIGFLDDTSSTVDVIEHHGDPYVATRRAIVRAAAEIGKGME